MKEILARREAAVATCAHLLGAATEPHGNFLAERLTTVQLDDAHFAAQLVERLKWAGEDAEHAEHEAAQGSVSLPSGR